MSGRKELIQLEELVRKAQSLIHPIGYEDTLKDLMTKPATDVFKGDYTKCVIPWKIGAQRVDLPICNRYGMVDPQVIKFAKKMNIIKLLYKTISCCFRNNKPVWLSKH